MLSVPGRLKFEVSAREHYSRGEPFKRYFEMRIDLTNESGAPILVDVKCLYWENLRTKGFGRARVDPAQIFDDPWFISPRETHEEELIGEFSINRAISSREALDDYRITMVVTDQFNEAHTATFDLRSKPISGAGKYKI